MYNGLIMRKGLAEAKMETEVFNLEVLLKLKQMGYNYVRIQGLTVDRHYEYIEPHFLVLVPFKNLSSDRSEMGIYEPVESQLLFQWATEYNDFTKIQIAKNFDI